MSLVRKDVQSVFSGRSLLRVMKRMALSCNPPMERFLQDVSNNEEVSIF